MHTTLEAFLREAIEEILRRKKSDMMRKMGERGLIYPSLMCGGGKPCGLWTELEVDEKWGPGFGCISRVEMQRIEDCSSANNYRLWFRLQ
jgi:hypothetical protein